MRIFGCSLILVLLVVPAPTFAEDQPLLSPRDVFHPVFAEHGMVATQEARATRVGVEVLRRGGNAIDAGVAIGFTLAATLPRAGNLGGGGFMMVHSAKLGETVAIDYRETAPAAAHRDLFLDDEGNVDTDCSRHSHGAVGVPGTVAGLALALERYGTMSLAEVLAPAIRYAEEGIEVDLALAESFEAEREHLEPWPETMRVFFKEDGSAYLPGERLVQPDLAASLRLLAAEGPKAFYEGAIAEKIAAEMEAHGGILTMEDLEAYVPVVREPVRGTYRGHDVVSMPPPSSGGVHLVQILNILEAYPLGHLGPNSAETIHLMVEAMRRAYADRSAHLGDPDFVKVPVAGLTSKAYAARLCRTIDRFRATPSPRVEPGDPSPYESDETTHFTVMDEQGNVVSNTYTLNLPFGSGITAKGTGILLNDEMDDFSAKAGEPNAFGLLGGDANAVEARKRPLSSMTPTIVFRDGVPFLATGSPGGSRIITTTVQVIVNVVDHGMNVAAATCAPRVHHQWLPDELRVERGLSPDTIRLLALMGHHVVEKDAMGSAQSILRTKAGFFGASDPRRPGALTLGL